MCFISDNLVANKLVAPQYTLLLLKCASCGQIIEEVNFHADYETLIKAVNALMANICTPLFVAKYFNLKTLIPQKRERYSMNFHVQHTQEVPKASWFYFQAQKGGEQKADAEPSKE